MKKFKKKLKKTGKKIKKKKNVGREKIKTTKRKK